MFVEYRLFACVCVYLLVHIDPADWGRCCGFPSEVEAEGGLSWGCGLGSHSSDHRQFALRPRPGRSLWARSEGALSLRPHTHQTWQVNDGVSRLGEEPRVQSLNEGTHHNTTANKQGNTPPPPHFYFCINSQLHVCLVIRDLGEFLCWQSVCCFVATRWFSLEGLTLTEDFYFGRLSTQRFYVVQTFMVPRW